MKDINHFITTTLWNRGDIFNAFFTEYKPFSGDPNKELF